MNTEYWTGFCTGIGIFSVIYCALFSFFLWCQRRLDKAKDDYIAVLKESYEEIQREAIKAVVAHDALLHVLRNRNDEGEEWKQ
jgi:hypothetical protein